MRALESPGERGEDPASKCALHDMLILRFDYGHTGLIAQETSVIARKRRIIELSFQPNHSAEVQPSDDMPTTTSTTMGLHRPHGVAVFFSLMICKPILVAKHQ